MLEVAGITDVAAVTTLSVILLIMCLIMGLKIRWFRAQMNMGATKSSSELGALVGMYRSQPFEVSSSTPLEPQSHNNVTASSSSHTSPTPPSSKLLSFPPLSVNGPKNNTQQKPLTSSPQTLPVGLPQPPKRKGKTVDENKTKPKSTSSKNPLSKPKNHQNSVKSNSLKNPHAGKSFPSNHKGKTVDGNKKFLFPFSKKNQLSKPEKHNVPSQNSVQANPNNPPVFATIGQAESSNHKGNNDVDGNETKSQPPSSKNPLAKLEKPNEKVEVKRPPDSKEKNIKPNGKALAPKGILPKIKSSAPTPPPVTTHDDSSTSLKLTDNSSTSLIFTVDSSTPLKLTDNSSTFLKMKTQIPSYVLEEEESESES